MSEAKSGTSDPHFAPLMRATNYITNLARTGSNRHVKTMAGKLTISIDLELAWGFWDILTPDIVRLAETAERPICDKLIELFDRYHIPVTWAVVAAVLDRMSAQGRPGNEASWYAPEIIERIRSVAKGDAQWYGMRDLLLELAKRRETAQGFDVKWAVEQFREPEIDKGSRPAAKVDEVMKAMAAYPNGTQFCLWLYAPPPDRMQHYVYAEKFRGRVGILEIVQLRP